METREPHPPELMRVLGREVYEQDIKHLVEPDHNVEIVAIDGDNLAWELARQEREAVNQLRSCHPGAFNILTVRVGPWAVNRFRSAPRSTRID